MLHAFNLFMMRYFLFVVLFMHALLLSSQTITFRVIDASDGTPVAGATLRLDGCRLYATGLAQGDDTALTIGSEALTFPTTDAGTAPTALPSASPRTAYTYTTATRWLSRKKAIIYIICVFIPSGGVRRLCKMFFLLVLSPASSRPSSAQCCC